MINNIISYLLSKGFVEENERYIKRTTQHINSPSIVVNGRQMNHPDRVVEVIYECDIIEGNSISDIPLILIHFIVQKNEQDVINYMEGFYYNEYDLFERMANKYYI